jgi:hypothetical protein
MFATIVMTLLFISFMFIIYFDYMLSIARFSSCPSISSHSARSKVQEVSDRYCVNRVLIRSLPAVGIS